MRQALLAVALLSACSAHRHPPPAGNLASTSLPEASELLESLARRRLALLGIRGLARISYTAPEQSVRAKQFLIAARPDRLRLEFLSPFSTVFVVATRDGDLEAYDPGERTLYRGRASVENLARYTQVALPIEDVVDALMATPRMLGDRPGVVSFDRGQVELWQDAGDDIRVVWFDQQLRAVRYERRDTGGNVLLRVNYSRYDPGDDESLPAIVDVELPADERRIEIKMKDIEVNPVLDDAVFALDAPPGSELILLEPTAW